MSKKLMNVYYEEIQKSFDLLNRKKTKKNSFLNALEYLLKIAEKSEYEVEKCTIEVNQDGDIVAVLNTGKATLTITANSRISYTGKGPRKGDNIHITDTESYSVNSEVFEWIKRNRKKV